MRAPETIQGQPVSADRPLRGASMGCRSVERSHPIYLTHRVLHQHHDGNQSHDDNDGRAKEPDVVLQLHVVQGPQHDLVADAQPMRRQSRPRLRDNPNPHRNLTQVVVLRLLLTVCRWQQLTMKQYLQHKKRLMKTICRVRKHWQRHWVKRMTLRL